MEFKTKQPVDIYINQIVATILLLSVFLFPQSLLRKLFGIPYVLLSFAGKNGRAWIKGILQAIKAHLQGKQPQQF